MTRSLLHALAATLLVLCATPALAQEPARAPDAPVVRAEGGNLGLFFRFGGLASLEATNNSRSVNGLILTQVGLKFVLSERLMIPVTFGTSLRNQSTGPADATDAGLDVGGGIEYHFRIWRRISPFIGGNLGVGFVNPTGDGNNIFGFGIGPVLGVEYYVADRVSLTAMYMFVIQIENQDNGPLPVNESTTELTLQTLAGGALNLTIYF